MRAVRTTGLLCLVGLLTAAGSPAQEASLRIVSPRPGLAMFDIVKVRVEVVGDATVDRVAFLLDGAPVGVVDEPPWVLDVDTGPDNRDKLLQVVAYGADRELARARLAAPALRIDVQVDLPLQQLFTTVTDRSGKRVSGLTRGAFTLRDDGRRQEIVTFAGGEIPFTAMLLIDGSQSMTGTTCAETAPGGGSRSRSTAAIGCVPRAATTTGRRRREDRLSPQWCHRTPVRRSLDLSR